MSVEQVLAFNAALLVALASPGPAMLVAIRTTLARGRAAGIATGLGLATAAATWTLMALMGLDALFRLFPWAYAALKTAGALYLIWIAWTTWRSAADPPAAAPRPRARSYMDGLLVNFGNPKSMLFAAAVLVVVFPGTLPLWQKGAIVLNHLALEIAAYTALAFVMSSEAVSRRYISAKITFDRVAAGVLGALGLGLLADRT